MYLVIHFTFGLPLHILGVSLRLRVNNDLILTQETTSGCLGITHASQTRYFMFFAFNQKMFLAIKNTNVIFQIESQFGDVT